MKWRMFCFLVITALLALPPAMAGEAESLSSNVPPHSVTTDNESSSPQLGQGSSEAESTPLHRQSGNKKPLQFKRLPFVPSTVYENQKTPFAASPSISIITPSAYGADWGSTGIGFGFQGRTRFTNTSDGVVGIGLGFGNAQKNIGLQLGIGLVDLDDLFADGTLSFKLHRQLPSNFNIAVGVQGATTWGDPDGGSSLFGVVTRRFALTEDVSRPFSEIYTSVGIGGGQFRSESDINDGVDSVGVFTSVAVRILEPMSFVTEWTGQDLTLGLSYVPFRNFPLVIVPAITDITGSAGDGTRFILGLSYGFSFR